MLLVYPASFALVLASVLQLSQSGLRGQDYVTVGPHLAAYTVAAHRYTGLLLSGLHGRSAQKLMTVMTAWAVAQARRVHAHIPPKCGTDAGCMQRGQKSRLPPAMLLHASPSQ